MNTTENNKLIADFMGYKTDEYGMYSKENGRGFFKSTKDNKGKTFDTSWDWLMPVVERIEEVASGVTIYRKGCHINEVGSFSGSINGFNHSSKIEQTYKAVVEFIKWYNENKTV